HSLMKILTLGWELPPHNSGGLGVACYQLCKALSKKDIDIEFVLPYTAEHDVDFMRVTSALPQNVTDVIKSGIAYDSYKYIYSDGSEEWMDIYTQQAVFEQSVGRLVEKLEFDVIHAHDWLTFRAGIRARLATGRPLVLHVHSIESDRSGRSGGGNPLVREIEGMAFMMADKIIAVSYLTKYAISREYGIPLSKIEVVHNSIDLEMVSELQGDSVHRYLTKMKADGYKVVINIGRLTIQKGLPNLLYAAKAVIDKVPKTLFLIVGAGEQYEELIELAANLGISRNVIFTGFQRGKNWQDSFAIGDLFVMPSVSEPFGLTPLEAVGYGTPSLISKQSGVAEVFDNCLKVDFWDVREMANQITAVVGNESLRDELHANALREYGRLSWGSAADKLVGLYRQHNDASGVSHRREVALV
ncbi:glycosyltransferase family 4 protein, partial [Candidatus Saccharibacteria bacterium]|nr:glycosyltransferase family 4 protein [Candidatus Saccharibacteria bacterium]